MSKIILITGASSGFGRLAAEALAKAGHTVYASMRETAGRNAPEVAKIAALSKGERRRSADHRTGRPCSGFGRRGSQQGHRGERTHRCADP